MFENIIEKALKKVFRKKLAVVLAVVMRRADQEQRDHEDAPEWFHEFVDWLQDMAAKLLGEGYSWNDEKGEFEELEDEDDADLVSLLEV